VGEPDVMRTIEAVWRIESARLIAGIARLVRDVGLAEDLAQEALLACGCRKLGFACRSALSGGGQKLAPHPVGCANSVLPADQEFCDV
jgi:hypothetical protein